MADGTHGKPVKVGVKQGGGPVPGYQWNVDLLNEAHADAIGFLTEGQYWHLSAQVRELAMAAEPTQSDTVDIRPVQQFHEIRDKGGILQKINARVFLYVHQQTRTIVVLGAFNKQNDGQTPAHVVQTMDRRRRRYLESLSPAPP